MKSQYLLIPFIFIVNLLHSQDKFCFEAPSLDFGGTKIAYSYILHDSTLSPTACQGIVYDKHRGNMWIAPLEYEDMYIINMGTASGSMTWALDKESNNILWRQLTNHLDDPDDRYFSSGFINKIGNDSLEMITFRGHWPWPTTPITAGRGGYPGRRIMNKNTGEVLSDYWIQDTLQDNLNLIYFTGLGVNATPQLIDGTEVYYNFNLFERNSDTTTLEWSHNYVDSKTLLRYRPFPPFNDLEGMAAPSIKFNFRGSNGSRPVGGYGVFGPLELSDDENMYFLRYQIEDVVHTHRIVIDDWGYLLDDFDITANIHNGQSRFYWYPDRCEVLNNGDIRLSGWEWQGSSIINSGYVIVDTEGNYVRENKSLEFDGLRPYFLKSKELFNRNSQLHVFRPFDDNDLYFYEEFQDGSYRNAGKLINNNTGLYAFEPKNIWQMENGDIFIHMNVRLDSIYNFSAGGWQCLLKINGDELGITTETKETQNSELISVYPNPTSDHINIKSKKDFGKIDVLLINRLGQVVYQKIDSDLNSYLSLQNIPSDMYFLMIRNHISKKIIHNQPILKIE